MVTSEELSSIEGFDENLAKELKNRAKSFLKKEEEENLIKVKDMGADEFLINDTPFTSKQLITLAENNIKTRDNLADLASDELIEIIGEKVLDTEKADEIIINARKHWFDK